MTATRRLTKVNVPVLAPRRYDTPTPREVCLDIHDDVYAGSDNPLAPRRVRSFVDH